jgi:hypothetical protein
MRRGEALRRLETTLAQRTPLELKDEIDQDYIDAGEILWHGTSGFAVSKSVTKRSTDEDVWCLLLQVSGSVQRKERLMRVCGGAKEKDS